ncbi:hypothetical protein KA005_61100, partial [bacterium]|nr:hypothetical protein [bacterium]
LGDTWQAIKDDFNEEIFGTTPQIELDKQLKESKAFSAKTGIQVAEETFVAEKSPIKKFVEFTKEAASDTWKAWKQSGGFIVDQFKRNNASILESAQAIANMRKEAEDAAFSTQKLSAALFKLTTFGTEDIANIIYGKGPSLTGQSPMEQFINNQQAEGTSGRPQVDATLLADLTKLKESLSGAVQGTNERTAAEKLLEKALTERDAQGNLILEDKEYDSLMESLRLRYRDMIDPIGKLNRETREEASLIGLSNVERNVAVQLRKEEQEIIDATGAKMSLFNKAFRKEAITTVERAKAYEGLKRQLDPVGEAMRDQKEALLAITAAQKTKTISDQEAATQITVLNFLYRDAIDPLAAINRTMKEQSDLFGKSNEERKVQVQLNQLQNQLQSTGNGLGVIGLAIMRARLLLQAEQNKQDQFNLQLKGQLESATERLARLRAFDTSSIQDNAAAMRAYGMAIDEAQLAVFRMDNSVRGGFNSSMQAMKMQIEDVGGLAEN